MESLLPRIGRVLRRVNGIDPEPGAPGCSPGFPPRLLPDDPGDLLHIKCLVMGLSLFRGRTIAAPQRQSRRCGKRFIGRNSQAGVLARFDFVRPET